MPNLTLLWYYFFFGSQLSRVVEIESQPSQSVATTRICRIGWDIARLSFTSKRLKTSKIKILYFSKAQKNFSEASEHFSCQTFDLEMWNRWEIRNESRKMFIWSRFSVLKNNRLHSLFTINFYFLRFDFSHFHCCWSRSWKLNWVRLEITVKIEIFSSPKSLDSLKLSRCMHRLTQVDIRVYETHMPASPVYRIQKANSNDLINQWFITLKCLLSYLIMETIQNLHSIKQFRQFIWVSRYFEADKLEIFQIINIFGELTFLCTFSFQLSRDFEIWLVHKMRIEWICNCDSMNGSGNREFVQ